MNICMIGHKTIPSRDGGIEVVVEELATRMVKKGHSLYLFNRKRSNKNKLREYKGCSLLNIFTVNIKSLDAIVYSFFATIKAKQMVKKRKLDIIHYHAEGPCIFLRLFGKKHKNFKLIVTIHGLDWQRSKWGGLASKMIKFGERQAVKYADNIIVLSKNNQNYFKEKYNRETSFIPNGVSNPIYMKPHIIKEKYNLEYNEYILFLARIVPEKGLDYLINARQGMSNNDKKNKKLVIAGGSSHSDRYFDSIKLKCMNDLSIVMTGFVSGNELNELFSNAYLYVLPSDVEGMPMSLLEALSYGNVCLVSDIPENTEVINDKCFTFKKGSVEDLRIKLKKIISFNYIRNNKNEGLSTWDDIVDLTLDVYKR